MWLICFGVLIIYLVLCCKLRNKKFYDDFHILEEFRLFALIVIAFFILYTVFVAALVALDEMNEDESWTQMILLFALFQSCVLVDIWSIYAMSRYVMKKIGNDSSLHHQYRTVPSADIALAKMLSLSREKTDTEDANCKETIKVSKILTDNNYFAAFMTHLTAEFSPELLLSLVEFIQFKQAIHRIMQSDASSLRNNRFMSIEFPECVPKSSIVHDEEDDFEQKAYKLYTKYVRVGSEYEINISFGLRAQLTHRFERNTEVKALVSVFDDCCNEMQRLLGYSLSRFKEKPQYLRLLDLEK